MLKIHNLNKKFNSDLILNNINLEVKKSEILGLAGESGGGKSTLLRCIQGLETPSSGHIECNGKTCFMFQDFQLFPHMTVLQNLTYAPHLNNGNKKTGDHSSDKSKKIEEIKAKAEKLLNNLGIGKKAHEYPHNLSGGQKQRTALARCLMINPELMLCDEPTSGLDPASICDIFNLLSEVKKSGVTMIIASHNLDFLEKISGRIVVLKNGKIQMN